MIRIKIESPKVKAGVDAGYDYGSAVVIITVGIEMQNWIMVAGGAALALIKYISNRTD